MEMAEKEYIEREAVMDALFHEQYGYLCEDAINSIPAADVRPVVMCCDCKYWKQWDSTTHYLCTYVAGAKFIRNADDFCSRGEREES